MYNDLKLITTENDTSMTTNTERKKNVQQEFV